MDKNISYIQDEKPRVQNQDKNKISIKATLTDKVSLAQQQNSYPMLLELKIANELEVEFDNLEVRLNCDPSFCNSKTWRLDKILGQSEYSFEDLEIKLSREFLTELKEAVKGNVTIGLYHNNIQIDEVDFPISVLGLDEWGGVNYLPELTAAFCCPNDPAVEIILKKSSEILRNSGLDPALEGYQTGDRKRVWQQISAIYNSIGSLGIDYTVPPASFETNGQKLRYPSRIMDRRLATCIDLALLFASCFEQCGLNSLVFLKKDHAFVGCWLVDEDFSLAVNDDPQAIRKRIALGEMVVLETTLTTHRPLSRMVTSFERAKKHLENESEFEFGVDIKRARMQAIKPVMFNDPVEPEIQPVKNYELLASPIEEAPELPDLEYVKLKEEGVHTPQGRIERWKRKLLDLTLRNKSINFKPTKLSIPIFCSNIGKLEDLLAAEDELKIIPAPRLMDKDDPRSALIHQKVNEYDAKVKHALEALNRKEIVVELEEAELNSRLVSLYRKSKTDMEEGGANTLYLSVGFLTWKQKEQSEKSIKSPLILIPITIKRRSVNSGFRIVIHEDEPRLNPTLLELLRQDFELSFPTIENELPEDDSGIDVELIWNTIRKEIKSYPGWEVTEEACLTTFSFKKYLMWKDLQDRTEILKENPVVKHLIDTPNEAYRDQGSFPDEQMIDTVYHPKDTFCPMLADSSQLSAVFAASEGRDFVLVGPPGTGKSQTITNIIVQSLAEGKKVLFVSEKMAALEVVYRRLKALGMGTFCLELHSTKAKKHDVVLQLGEAWDSAGRKTSDEWEGEAEKLQKSRNILNNFPRHLHKQYRNGLTPFKAYSYLSSHKTVPMVSLGWSSFDHHSKLELDELREISRRLDINVKEVGGIYNNPFEQLAIGAWSNSWQSEFEVISNKIRTNSVSLKEIFLKYCKNLGIPNDKVKFDKLEKLIDLANHLLQAFQKDYAFFITGEAKSICKDLRSVSEKGKKHAEISQKLSVQFMPTATFLKIANLQGRWEQAEGTIWPIKIYKFSKLRTEIQNEVARGQKLKFLDIPSDLQKLSDLADLEKEIDQLSSTTNQAGKLWNGLESDWDEIEIATKWGGSLSEMLSNISDGDLDLLLLLREKITRIITAGNEFLSKNSSLGVITQKLTNEYKNFLNSQNELHGHINDNTGFHNSEGTVTKYLEAVEDKAKVWLENVPKLRSWCSWIRLRDEAIENGLSSIVEAIVGGNIGNEKLATVFEVSYRDWWVKGVVDEDEVLREFASAEHERQINTFKKLDDRFMRLTKKYVRAKLSGDIPSKNQVGHQNGTEWGTLNRELNRQRGHMPLRKLVGCLPNVISKLAPCQLMSPLSIAQYLDSNTNIFDLVIFDEASQIPVWDAIGAIARAKQTIVVGDPKQLPPTNFFTRPGNDEEEEIEDLESILDECLGARMPVIDLRWHYRSRHESLITFSNHRYYSGRLITFPAAKTEDVAVKYHHVPLGIYEIGTGRVNRKEAEAVTRAVVGWLQNPEFTKNEWSLGVVTFNSQQKSLIEDLLDNERKKNPLLEAYFSDETVEPVFVKNIENVQGDERDIILFSVTFAHSASGKLSMNFGPMNKDGGERRLNVAITRARQALHVYGTLRGEDIDLSRSNALGVRDFKHFLEYAEKGPKAITEAIEAPGDDYDSGFEEQVSISLQRLGWNIHPQVGVSGFRIDLGVVHPDHPGIYLAGVECDGATYHRSATARDRDRLRELVLNDLGWEILRVWSTDWWIDPESITKKLNDKLNLILEKYREKDDSEKEGIQANFELMDEPKGTEDLVEDIVPGEEQIDTQSQNHLYFKEAIIEERDFGYLNPDLFYTYRETSKIANILNYVVEIEGPISLEMLATRVARAYKLSRTGAKIKRRIESIGKKQFTVSHEENNIYFWPKEKTPKDFNTFRTLPLNSDLIIDAHCLCIKELQNLACYIRDVEYPFDDKDLAKSMSEKLGYKKMTSILEKRLMIAVRKMHKHQNEG